MDKLTKLETFLRAKGIKPADVAREARVSRQHLLRLRKGIAQPTITMLVKITNACSALLGRTVAYSELFDGMA